MPRRATFRSAARAPGQATEAPQGPPTKTPPPRARGFPAGGADSSASGSATPPKASANAGDVGGPGGAPPARTAPATASSRSAIDDAPRGSLLAAEPVTALPRTSESERERVPDRTATAPPAAAATLPSKSDR